MRDNDAAAVLSAIAALRADVQALRDEIRQLREATPDVSRLHYLTLREAATYLRVTPNALRKRMRSGAVPAWCYTRLGRDHRFMRVALDQALGADVRVKMARRFSRGT